MFAPSWTVKSSNAITLSVSFLRSRLAVKLDPLRQRQLIGPVNSHSLPPHVGFPGIAAGFAAAAGNLLASERATNLRPAGPDIDVRDSAVTPSVAQKRLG